MKASLKGWCSCQIFTPTSTGKKKCRQQLMNAISAVLRRRQT